MMMSSDQKKMEKYELQKDIPLCPAGTVFVHDKSDRVRGSLAEGCLKLAWTDGGDCQAMIGAETIIFHASVLRTTEWFVKTDKPIKKLKVTSDGTGIYDPDFKPRDKYEPDDHLSWLEKRRKAKEEEKERAEKAELKRLKAKYEGGE